MSELARQVIEREGEAFVVVDVDNAASLALHRGLGFQDYARVEYLFVAPAGFPEMMEYMKYQSCG